MTELVTKYNDVTGGFISKPAGGDLFTEQVFPAVTGGGQTVFQLSFSINALQVIDVWVNDRKSFETADWTRDDVTNRITFLESQLDTAVIRVRAWL